MVTIPYLAGTGSATGASGIANGGRGGLGASTTGASYSVTGGAGGAGISTYSSLLEAAEAGVDVGGTYYICGGGGGSTNAGTQGAGGSGGGGAWIEIKQAKLPNRSKGEEDGL